MKRQDLEDEVARLLQRRPAALTRLQSLPNVRTVGVGLRITGGKPTGELAFRVYVDTKVPREGLSPDDVIPETIDGIPTDVIQIGRGRKLCWAKGTRPVIGGIEVAPSPFDTMMDSRGTLGCLVTTSDGKIAALSDEHVLEFKTKTDKTVYQPHYDQCLGFDCNKIGKSVDGFEDHFEHEGTSFWLDCAIAVLDSGIDRRFRLRRVVNNAVGGFTEVPLPPGVEGTVRINNEGKVVSIRDEQGDLIDTSRIAGTAAALPGTIVWKVGNRSKLTAGIVDDPQGPVTDDRTGDVNNNLILIRALAGYEGDGIPLFADEGDSGAMVLDLSNNIVGMVTGLFTDTHESTGGPVERFAYCGNIAPILARLKISINATPAIPTPTAAVVLSDEQPDEAEEQDFGELLHALEMRVLATSTGPVLMTLLERHAAEVYNLVNRRRAVTVVWHRHQGPAFVALFARALRDPGGPLTKEANHVPLRSMLTAMAGALHQHGSSGLQVDLDEYKWMINLIDACHNLDELVAALDTMTAQSLS